ncbi:MAG TPA: TIGR03905 family TSCPD domain-containing protein [Candidatus Dorea intestinavium]|nr:TIGR03905 family TSCPD domain-containing protein [Candidatus Dorea intestinavium]
MNYKTTGVCSRYIHVDVADEVITHVDFEGGCDGNLQGISQLVRGMNISDAITRLEGIKCHSKATSCPDQLAQALKEIVNQK